MVILVEPCDYLSDAEASRNTGLQSGDLGGKRDPMGYKKTIITIK